MTDIIIAALIVTVIIAFVRMGTQRKAILRLESKLDNLQQQLADVMAMVYAQHSESTTTRQQSSNDTTTNESVIQPPSAIRPNAANTPVVSDTPARLTPNPTTELRQPTVAAVASLPDSHHTDSRPKSNTHSIPQSIQTSAQLSTNFSAHSATSTSTQFSRDDESAPNIVTSLWATATKWFFGENLVVRVGALVLLVGVVLLLKLASQYIQVSMPVRMALVAIGGFVMTAIGYRTTAKRRNYGLTLQGVGFAVIYLTVFASFKRYGLLPPTLTFVMLAMLAGLTVMFSVWQNALPLAILAFGGAFFAPIFVSGPDGSVVMLFSYYLLLNIAVAIIAYYRTWKLLNALSLAVTFGIAYAWGLHQFATDSVATSWLSVRWQLVGLLVAHIGLYLFIAVRYAQQVVNYNQTIATKTNGLIRRPILSVDLGLLFGTALLGFGLMASLLNDLPYHLAFASSALSFTYLALGFWLLKRHRQSLAGHAPAKQQFDQSFEVLIEASLALGCGFLALVIPLALSAKWLSIGWAVQGAALVWLGWRTQRHWAVYIGLVLQAMSVVLLVGFDGIMRDWYSLLDRLSIPHQAEIVAPATSLPWAILAACGLLSAFMLRQGIIKPSVAKPTAGKAHHTWVQTVANQRSHGFATVLVVVGFILYLSAILAGETFWQNDGKITTIKLAIGMTVFLIAGQLLHQRFVWASMRAVSRWVLPMTMLMWMAVCAVNFTVSYANTAYGVQTLSGLGRYLLAMVGCLAVATLLGAWLLSRWHRDQLHTRVDQLIWLLVLIGTLTWLLQEVPFSYWQHDTELRAIVSLLPTIIGVFVLMALLLLPTLSAMLGRFGRWLDVATLLKDSAYLLVPITLIWTLLANFSLNGQLLGVYIPVLNPLDLTLLSILLYQFFVALNVKKSYRNIVLMAGGVGVFVTVSSMLVRVFASAWGTPTWAGGAWSVSIVQTGLTILWTVLAMVLMFVAHKKSMRLIWFAGMALLTMVVAKLVLIDMSNTSAVLRVVSFIGAGLLMLVIGYLAPLPPKDARLETTE